MGFVQAEGDDPGGGGVPADEGWRVPDGGGVGEGLKEGYLWPFHQVFDHEVSGSDAMADFQGRHDGGVKSKE